MERQPLATRDEVAVYLGVPKSTLALWATRDEGPAYRIVGRRAQYDWGDVDAWVRNQPLKGGIAA